MGLLFVAFVYMVNGLIQIFFLDTYPIVIGLQFTNETINPYIINPKTTDEFIVFISCGQKSC